MNLNQLLKKLDELKELQFYLPNGTAIPAHAHVTEVTYTQKQILDCGKNISTENYISIQLWEADDYEHRLSPAKLSGILKYTKDKLELPNLNIKVEYQENSISLYDLELINDKLSMVSTHTDCRAKESCGIPKRKISLADLKPFNTLQNQSKCC
ncbi:hypothetical protein GYB22_13250 [bacterium]|nr:hypothetical protein [bacterium]